MEERNNLFRDILEDEDDDWYFLFILISRMYFNDKSINHHQIKLIASKYLGWWKHGGFAKVGFQARYLVGWFDE